MEETTTLHPANTYNTAEGPVTFIPAFTANNTVCDWTGTPLAPGDEITKILTDKGVRIVTRRTGEAIEERTAFIAA